jgi:hypothetical protein
LYYQRKTLLQQSQDFAFMGLAAESSFLVKAPFSIDIQGVTNIASSGVVFTGGSLQGSWFLLGGMNDEHKDEFIEFATKPSLNVFLSLGLTMRTFDFIPETLSVTEILSDSKHITHGTLLGPQWGLGCDIPLGPVFLGARYQGFFSFITASSPTILAHELWFYLSYSFVSS